MHRKIAWLAACLLLPADFASAHPGHGVTDPTGPAHYVFEPMHSLPILLIALAIGSVWCASRMKRRSAARQERRIDD